MSDIAPPTSTPSPAAAPHSVGSTPVPASAPSLDEVRRSYDSLHAERTFESPPGFYPFLIDCLAFRPGDELLDVGCGIGGLLRAAADRGARIAGLDLSEVAIETARSELPPADLRVGSAEELPWPDAHFDRVSCIGTLEHLPDPRAGAREIARVLRPDGFGVVWVPNTYYWIAVLKTIRTGEGHDEGQVIQRHGSRNEWRDLLESEGLRVDAVRTWRYPIRLRPWNRKIFVGSLIERVVPRNLLLAFAYVVRLAR